MKSIIERLEIHKAPWKVEHIDFDEHRINAVSEVSGCECTIGEIYRHENAMLVSKAPEMLEELIDYCYSSDVFLSSMKRNGLDIMFDSLRYNKIIPIIESATGKSWEEIKELLN